MPATRKCHQELKERATRLALDARRDATTRRGAIVRIAGQLDIHPEALRGWVRLAEAASSTTSPSSRARTAKDGEAVGEEVSDRQRILELEAKFTRANLILRQGGCRANRRCGSAGLGLDDSRIVVWLTTSCPGIAIR